MRILALLLLLSGCASMSNPYGMTQEQIAEVVKDKNSAAVCLSAQTPAGNAKLVVVNNDRGAIPYGTMTVDDKCIVTITTANKPPTP